MTISLPRAIDSGGQCGIIVPFHDDLAVVLGIHETLCERVVPILEAGGVINPTAEQKVFLYSLYLSAGGLIVHASPAVISVEHNIDLLGWILSREKGPPTVEEISNRFRLHLGLPHTRRMSCPGMYLAEPTGTAIRLGCDRKH